MGVIGAIRKILKKLIFLIAPIEPSTTQRSVWCILGLIGAIRKIIFFNFAYPSRLNRLANTLHVYVCVCAYCLK